MGSIKVVVGVGFRGERTCSPEEGTLFQEGPSSRGSFQIYRRLYNPRRALGQWGARMLQHLARRIDGEIRKRFKRRRRRSTLRLTMTLFRKA